MTATGSLNAAVAMLVKKPWIPTLAVTGWFVGAYLHLRPAASVNSSLHPSAAYGPWAYGHMAYSDTLSLYYSFHLANHALPVGCQYSAQHHQTLVGRSGYWALRAMRRSMGGS
jgi:hypothetical protein